MPDGRQTERPAVAQAQRAAIARAADPAAPIVAPRNGAIDVLRGLSILFVILHHLALNFRLPLGPTPLAELLGARLVNTLSHSGYAAVYCFFVISGFLIARRVLQQHGSFAAIDVRRFYWMRMSRILPLLLALLVVSSFLHWLAVPDYTIHRPQHSLGGAWFAALALHLNWYEGMSTWLPGNWDVLWSLSIEELFYLCFPLACIALPRWLLLPGLVLLAASLPWTRALLDGREIWQEKAYLPAMSAIACGVLAAWCTQRFAPSRGFARALLWLGALGLAGALLAPGELWRATGHTSLLLIAATAAVFLCGCAWLDARAPRGLRWLARMGRLSYELYLSHMFVVLPVVAAWRARVEDPRWNFLPWLPVVLLCVWLAALIERRLSKPCESWMRGRWAR